MKKAALFVFNGDPMCFIHVLLNAIDMRDKEIAAEIIIEGAATKLIPELEKNEHFLHGLWEKTKALKLIGGVCRACASKMGTIEDAKKLGFTLLDDMSGHPSIAGYRLSGYEIITF